MKTEEKQKCVVLIEDWQMQCCGDPFKIGDNIKWTVEKWTQCADPLYFDKPIPFDIDYCYEKHGDNGKPLFELTGLVKEIKTLYDRHEATVAPKFNKSEIMRRIYEKAVDVTTADGWDKDIDGLKFGGYVVVLQDCYIWSK